LAEAFPYEKDGIDSEKAVILEDLNSIRANATGIERYLRASIS
jgi:hypothetical protein